MRVVVDASLVVVLATRDPRAGLVEPRVRAWLDGAQELHAPFLLLYEVASAFTRLTIANRMTSEDLASAWSIVQDFPLHYHSLASGPRVVEIATGLGRTSAYDASYIALAEEIGGELWTIDGPLARNAAGLQFPVHLID